VKNHAPQSKMSSPLNPSYNVKKRQQLHPDHILRGLADHDRFVLSEAITLLESSDPQKRHIAETVLSLLGPPPAGTVRVGITGSPGVGKSTFIEAFGNHLIQMGHRPAVLAIDPSSIVSGGSILGDKTRMPSLSVHPSAYIRPSPSGQELGGTTLCTSETIRLCEATGYDYIIVETVGVGQSETDIQNIADVCLLLLQPGAGDEIQGLKRGIMEAADILVINKADTSLLQLAAKARSFYESVVRLFHHDVPGWTCPVITVSSLENKGLDTVFNSVRSFMALLEGGLLEERRRSQEQKWFEKKTLRLLEQVVLGPDMLQRLYKSLAVEVGSGKKSAGSALQELNGALLNSFRK